MNQILNSEPEATNNKKVNKNYNSNKKNYNTDYSKNNNVNNYNNYNNYSDENIKTKKISDEKIIRIFAICMIIFAVGLISSGVYSYMNNQEYNEDINTNPVATAKITAEEVDGKVRIYVSDKKNIKQLVYSWNGQKENKIQGEGKELEKVIDLPAGNNNLLVSVISEDGAEATLDQNFESEDGVDIINPEISLEVKDSKLVITATDENSLDFITYRWNDDEEQIVTSEDDEKQIQVELDVMKGENDITIVAVDKNKNTTSETKTFRGVTQPEILFQTPADGSYLDITCTHEKGIKRIEYTLNDVPYEGDFDDSPTSVQFQQPLDVGYNRIIITAISVEDTKYTFDGYTTYYPEGYDASSIEDTNE